MTVCADVYTRPQSCDVIRIYPSQVHPGGGGRPHGAFIKREHHKVQPEQRIGAEDELAVILLLESFTTSD